MRRLSRIQGQQDPVSTNNQNPWTLGFLSEFSITLLKLQGGQTNVPMHEGREASPFLSPSCQSQLYLPKASFSSSAVFHFDFGKRVHGRSSGERIAWAVKINRGHKNPVTVFTVRILKAALAIFRHRC